MTKGVKVGDVGTAHDGFPETPILSGSPDVKFDGQAAARVGDPLLPHSKPKHPPHPRTISSGSSTVFINGKPAAITGGEISCGGVTIGSGTVNIGDKYQPISNSNSSSSTQKKSSTQNARANIVQKSSTDSIPSQTVQIPKGAGYWPPYNPLAKEGEKELNVEYVSPITSVAVMSAEEANEFYQNLYVDLGGKDALGNIKDYGGLTKGTFEAYATAKGLGGFGVTAFTKNINGKDWVIIKDFRRYKQTIMKGNKWGANNPRVVQMGLGLNDIKGAVRYVRFNVGVEVVFAIGINAADYIIRDEATLAELAGNSAGDLVKGLISLTGAAIATIALPATVGVLATGAIFALVSFGIGQGLNYIDEQNGYSKNITDAVESYF